MDYQNLHALLAKRDQLQDQLISHEFEIKRQSNFDIEKPLSLLFQSKAEKIQLMKFKRNYKEDFDNKSDLIQIQTVNQREFASNKYSPYSSSSSDISQMILSSSDAESDAEDLERNFYREMHADDKDITSGYSTISSNDDEEKEEFIN